MISILLGRELRVRLARDPGTKDRLLSFELAGLVTRIHPVQDLFVVIGRLSTMSLLVLVCGSSCSVPLLQRHVAADLLFLFVR